MKLGHLRALPACLGLLLFGTSFAATQGPPFPRFAVSWVNNENYQDPTLQAKTAQTDVATLVTWPGWQNGRGTTLQQVVQNIKAASPNTLVFEYIKNNEIDGTIATNAVYSDLFNKLGAMSWYLYASGTSGSPLAAAWPGATELNNTLFTPVDSNGDDWISWFSKWAIAQYYVPNPALDGFNEDNVFATPRVSGDYNRDGVTDSTTTAAPWVRQGDAKFFQLMHQRMPGKYQIGNIADWGNPSSTLTEYVGQLDGGILEGMIGYSWSVETWGGWQMMMAWYRKTMAALGGPKIAIFAQVGDPTDYQSFRYGFASCFLDDGYFQFDSTVTSDPYANRPWFDEYDYRGKLGAPTSAPPTVAWQKGVYRRDYANGIVLVNPKGNGPQTVQLETTYQRISGTQAPAVNSGQTVQTLTLQDRDGIMLMRVNAAASAPAKVPNPPSTIEVH